MTYQIIITDDNPADILCLRTLTEEWAELRKITCGIVSYSSAEDFLFHCGKTCTCDLLFLDIEMPGIDGVSLAKTVRKSNKNVNIVFITGYSDYISEGYEVSALHYLMKPVNKDKLFCTLDRAYERSVRNMQYLTLKLPDTIMRVPFGDIRYLEVRQNYVTVYADKEYTIKQTLGEFEKQLAPDDSFFRVGRSYIVNLRCIRQVTKKEIFLLDSTVIPLPRGMYEPLNREIIRRL